MALAITATLPSESPGAVVLQVTGVTPPTSPVTITRSDANGVAPVRFRTGQVPIAGTMTVVDAEGALVGLIAYTVKDGSGATAQVSTSLEDTTIAPRIHAVQVPQMLVTPPLVTGYDGDRVSLSTVHQVVMRTDPVVVLAGLAMRTGTLTLWFLNHADARAAQTALGGIYVMMLRQADHAGLDMYFAVVSVDTTPLQATAAGWRWTVAVGYVEVRTPSGALLGSPGWDYGDVTAAYPTYTALPVAYPTYADLAVGP